MKPADQVPHHSDRQESVSITKVHHWLDWKSIQSHWVGGNRKRQFYRQT